jgi:hypothetical protein
LFEAVPAAVCGQCWQAINFYVPSLGGGGEADGVGAVEFLLGEFQVAALQGGAAGLDEALALLAKDAEVAA